VRLPGLGRWWRFEKRKSVKRNVSLLRDISNTTRIHLFIKLLPLGFGERGEKLPDTCNEEDHYKQSANEALVTDRGGGEGAKN